MKQLIETVFGSWKKFLIAWGLFFIYGSLIMFINEYFEINQFFAIKYPSLQERLIDYFVVILYSSLLLPFILFYMYLKNKSNLHNILGIILKRWKYIISISFVVALLSINFSLLNNVSYFILEIIICYLLFPPAFLAQPYAFFGPMKPFEAIIESYRHFFSKYFWADLKLIIFPFILMIISQFVSMNITMSAFDSGHMNLLSKYYDYIDSIFIALLLVLINAFVLRRMRDLGRVE